MKASDYNPFDVPLSFTIEPSKTELGMTNFRCKFCSTVVSDWKLHQCSTPEKPKCTCGPHQSINEQQIWDDRCSALAYNDGVAHIHPLGGWKPARNSVCLRCDAPWPAGETHVCMDYLTGLPQWQAEMDKVMKQNRESYTWTQQATTIADEIVRKTTEANSNKSFAKSLDPILKQFAGQAAAQMTLNCPTCNRPILSKDDEPTDPSADTDFTSVVMEFLKVDHLASVQDKVERLSKVFRFERREPITTDRED